MDTPNTLDKPKEVEFLKRRYRLMGGRKQYYLSQARTNSERIGAKGLHVAIWEEFHQTKVPKYFEIHHKDGNTFNNSPDNLECLSIGEHRRMNKVKDIAKQLEHLNRVRPLTVSWHRSEEGRAWHREHALKQRRKKLRLRCEVCNKSFWSVHSFARTCHRNCYARLWRRENKKAR